MEAHRLLQNEGFDVKSYGTGSTVKLPGPAIDKPNVYMFGAPYTVMYEELQRQNESLYIQNGVLQMLDRNRRIKKAPERFQETSEQFDVVITFEERVFDAVLDFFNSSRSIIFQPVYIVNLEVNDTHAEAAVGAKSALKLAQMLDSVQDLDEDIQQALNEYENTNQRAITYALKYY